jgi:UDP-glucuronate 4-epimerase
VDQAAATAQDAPRFPAGATGRYLVTGAAGFIGFAVAERLLVGGHQVVGVDNLNDAYDRRLKEWRLARLQRLPGFTFQRVDIADRLALNPIWEGEPCEAVIHLAARAGVRQSVANPWAYVDTNITGTLNLLEGCRRREIPKFVLASTSSVYGADAPLPTPETHDSDRPLQPYAATKKAAEALAHSYHFLHGLDVTVLRYFTVYGPAGRPDMSMFRFCQWISEGRTVRINGDGEQSRGFTYLDDIARGTLLALKPLGFEVVNLGGHETIRINDLLRLMEEKIGREAQVEYGPAHPADMLANWANVDKAGRLLGWEPRTGLTEGVARLVDWYREERSWASDVDTAD